MTGIFRWIERHAEKTPDKPAILFEGETITYADFAGRVRAAAGALKNTYGIQPGDRVAYLGLGLPDAFYLLFACARIGAMFLPMNWRLAAPEHQFILGDSGATLLIADADHQARAKELQKLLPALTLAACDFEAEGWTPFWAAEAGEEPEPESGADDPVLLVYTSGTTGAPKGAVLTQGAITVNALNAIHVQRRVFGKRNGQHRVDQNRDAARR